MPIDWVRSGRTGKYLALGHAARTECSMTSSQICSRPLAPRFSMYSQSLDWTRTQVVRTAIIQEANGLRLNTLSLLRQRTKHLEQIVNSHPLRRGGLRNSVTDEHTREQAYHCYIEVITFTHISSKQVNPIRRQSCGRSYLPTYLFTNLCACVRAGVQTCVFVQFASC